MENSCNTDNRFDGKKLIISEQEWKKKLSPEAFKILRNDSKLNNMFSRNCLENNVSKMSSHRMNIQCFTAY